jgi:hypothetical protein
MEIIAATFRWGWVPLNVISIGTRRDKDMLPWTGDWFLKRRLL